MKSHYSHGNSTARSSTLSYASSTEQNNTQSIVLDDPRGIMIRHMLYTVMPHFFVPLALLLNFLLLIHTTGPINACYIIYAVYFYRLMFGAPCAAFADVNLIEIERYLNVSQHAAASVQFTCGIIMKTLICIILVVFAAFGVKRMGIISGNPQESAGNTVTFTVLLVFALFIFAQWDECKNIYLVQHRVLIMSFLFLALAALQLTFCYLYFLIVKRYNPLLFEVISCILISIPLLYALASHCKFLEPKGEAQLLSLNLKAIFPIRWSMIGLIMLRFLEYLIDAVDIPMMEFFVIFYERGQSGNAMDELEMLCSCAYVILFEMGSAFNKAIVEFLLRFVGINFDYKMYSRIYQLLCKDLLPFIVAAIIYNMSLFLIFGELTPIIIKSFPESVEVVENKSNVLGTLWLGAISPLLNLIYQILMCVLKITGAYRGNLYLIISLSTLAMDLLLAGVYQFFIKTERSIDILLYSSLLKLFTGFFGFYWILKWVKNERETVEIPDPAKETPQEEISEVSVRQAANASTSKVDSQLFATDENMEVNSMMKFVLRSAELKTIPQLKPNMTMDFLAEQDASK